MSDARLALELLEVALAERSPHAQACRVATFLSSAFDLALCGVSFHDGEAECAAVATTMSEGTANIHLERFFPGGVPAHLSMIRVAQGAQTGIGTHRWDRAEGAPVSIFWLGRSPVLESLCALAGELVATALERAVEARCLERLAAQDALTGLANARAFWTAVAQECARSARYGNRLSLALIDLDGFKDVNDRHGHLEGDRVLREAARAIHSCVRDSDIVARLGGDEFAILLPESDAHAAWIVADRVLAALSRITVAGEPTRASVGIAQAAVGLQVPEALVDAADRAMYDAKRHGGHRASSVPAPQPAELLRQVA